MGSSLVPEALEDLSEEWLRDNVLKQEIVEEFVILDHQVVCATNSEDRDGYMSLMLQIETEVELKTNGREKKRFNLFAKLFPPNEEHRKKVRKLRAFDREVHVYNSLRQQIRSVQRASSAKLEPCWPRCVYAAVDQEKGVSALIMEDLKASGFILMDKTKGLSFQHLELCMKAFARTHALTFNLKNGLGLEQMLLRNHQLLDNPMLEFDDIFDTNFEVAIHYLRGYGRPDLAQKMQDYQQKHGTVMSYINSLLDRPHRMRTLTQGDCWINNMMFRHEVRDGKEAPVEVKLLDLQIMRYLHPCTDLVYLIFGGSNSRQRNPVDQLLRTYYDTFFDILFQTGSTFCRSDYTFEELKADFEVFRHFGLVIGTLFIIVSLTNPQDMPNLDHITEDLNVVWERWLQEQKKKPVPKNIGSRLVDLVEDANSTEEARAVEAVTATMFVTLFQSVAKGMSVTTVIECSVS
ncbi:unnamed protein product [Cyprideis torosa]|uniref:Uncharacterized protein n=1 Tax=Cyprideis torosa TaxID=163714 RepID=A0A7R8WQY9_9CRUS|nr:unnamed protein product [Cyprideis torosa]CAG0906516.1 unnamed protein product [Cyprideis torosa]